MMIKYMLLLAILPAILLLTRVNSQNIYIKNVFVTVKVIDSVKYSPDGKYLAYTCRNSRLVILNATDYTEIRSTSVGFGAIHNFAGGLAFSRQTPNKLAYNLRGSNLPTHRVTINADNTLNVISGVISNFPLSSMSTIY